MFKVHNKDKLEEDKYYKFQNISCLRFIKGKDFVINVEN